jgi:hypothetical protein
MCLTISVEFRGIGRKEAESIVAQTLSNKLELQLQEPVSLFGPRTPFFSLSEVGEGCACSMLTDNADWNAPTWEFQSTLLEDLASSLEMLCKQAPNGLVLEALWAGDKAKEILEVSCTQLLDIIRSNSISTGAKYFIPAA